MPFGDRTGPLGRGPVTGRGLGYCAGFNEPGFVKPGGWGRGWGRGWRCGFWGWGRGWGWKRFFRFFPFFGTSFLTPEETKKVLKEEAEFLKKRLEAVEKKLSEMEEVKNKQNQNNG